MTREAGEVSWANLSAADRAGLIEELTDRAGKARGDKGKVLRAAVARLTVAPKRKKRAREYQHSAIGRRLNLPESRSSAIATIIATVKEMKTIEAAAEKLEVSSRSLWRMIGAHPDLREAIDALDRRQNEIWKRFSSPATRHEAMATIIAAVKEHGSIDAAADALELSHRRLRHLVREHADLREAIDALKGQAAA